MPEGVIARFGTLRWRDGASHLQPTLSPDGKFIVFTAQSGDIRVLDAATGRETRRLRKDREPLRPGVVFSSDGKLLAAVDDDDRLHIWEFASGQQRSSFPAGRYATTPTFSADARLISTVSGFPGGGVFVWDATSGKQLARVTPLQFMSRGAVLSPDGKYLMTWGMDMPRMSAGSGNSGVVQLWEVRTSKETRQLGASAGHVAAAAFAPDGKAAAVLKSGIESSRLSIFDPASGDELQTIRELDEETSQFAFAPDGKTIATVDPKNAVTLWDVATGKQLRGGPGGAALPHSLVFLGDRMLACGSSGQCIRLWEPLTGKELSPTQGHLGGVTSVAFSSDSRTLTSVDSVRDLITWDLAADRLLSKAHVSTRSAPARFADYGAAPMLTPDSLHLVTDGSTGIVVRELTARPGGGFRESQLLPGDGFTHFVTAFSPDGDLMAVADYATRGASCICVASVRSGKVLHRIPYAQGYFKAVAISADLHAVAAEIERDDLRVFIWDVSTGHKICDFELPPPAEDKERKDALAFTGDSRSLLVAGPGGAVTEWDVATGKQVRVLGSEAGWQPQCLLLTRDGNTLAVGMQSPETGRGKVQLWEARTGSVRAEFGGHEGAVTCLAFSRDQRLLAVGSSDTTVLLCDVTGAADHGPLATRLDSHASEQLWADLASTDARRAYRATWRLRAAPKDALALLSSRPKPAAGKTATKEEMARLIRNLDAPGFALREQAVRELRGLGAQPKDALKKALSTASSPEMRKRIEALLASAESHRPADDELRELRAVEVLETIGDSQAKQLLTVLGKGRPDARLTVVARGSLQRLTSAVDAGRSAERVHPEQDEGTVRVDVDADSGPLPRGALQRFGTMRYRQPGEGVTAAISPDGRLVAIAGLHGVRLMDAATGKDVGELKASETWVGSELAFSPDGRLLACDSIGEGVIVWELTTKKQVANFANRMFRAGSRTLVFSADGRTLALVNEGMAMMSRGSVDVWEATTGKHLHMFSDSAKGCDHGALSPDGKLLATCPGMMARGLSDLMNPAPRNSIFLWDVAAGKEVRHIDVWARMLDSLVFAPDGKSLAVCCDMGDIRILDPETGKEKRSIHSDVMGHEALYYSPDSKFLVAVAQGRITTWDVATGQQRDTCQSPPCEFVGLAFGKDGIRACGTWGQTVRIWAFPSGKELAVPAGHFGQIASLAFRRNGRELVSSGITGEFCVWDLSSGRGTLHDSERSTDRMRAHPDHPACVIAPDGKLAVRALGFGEQLRCEEIDTGNVVCEVESNMSLTSGTELSRNGRVAATGGRNRRGRTGIILCWDTATGRALHEFSCDAPFASAALSGDGQRIAIADGEWVTVFDARSGAQIGKGLHSRYTWRAPFALSPDGQSVAMVDEDSRQLVVRDVSTRRTTLKLSSEDESEKNGRLSHHDGVCLFSDDGRTLAFAAMNESGERSRILVWEIASGAERAEFVGHAGKVASLAFSPDGRLLASGGADTTIFVWDLTGLGRGPAPALSAQQAEALWPDLASEYARRAYRAMWHLIGSPAQAVRMLEGNLKPASAAAVAELRVIRACEILERIGNDAARRLLDSLAKGAADAGITREAKASLERLKGHQ